ncbi:MAG: polyprenol monophosphomannose synthase [Saprospiraceae bacterium]
MPGSLVIIPTYNEKENIISIIDAVLKLNSTVEVLVVDDGSPDGTGEIVKSIQLRESRVHLLERSGKLGLGTAYITGFKWGLSKEFDYLIEMDADFSHPPAKILELLGACNAGSDVAIGSRYVRGGKVNNWPWDRLFLSYGASLYVRLITGMPVKDPTAGFVCYKRRVLEKLELDKIRFVGYAFQIEMKYKAWIKGFNLVEIPITFTDRIEGTSKMHGGIIKEAALGVIQLRLGKNK